MLQTLNKLLTSPYTQAKKIVLVTRALKTAEKDRTGQFVSNGTPAHIPTELRLTTAAKEQSMAWHASAFKSHLPGA